MGTILLLSGPNLNLLGERRPELYGTETLDDLVARARRAAQAGGHELEHYQSNHEGDLVDAVQRARGRTDAIVCNAAAYTHYSYALADAFECYEGIAVELHITDPTTRAEPWRHHSVLAPHVAATVAGLGGAGYEEAVGIAARLIAEAAP